MNKKINGYKVIIHTAKTLNIYNVNATNKKEAIKLAKKLNEKTENAEWGGWKEFIISPVLRKFGAESLSK